MSVTAAQKGNSEDIKGPPFPLLSRSNDGFHAAQRFRLGVLGPLPLDTPSTASRPGLVRLVKETFLDPEV
ncbi:UNVERIFIED_CONTAM: hypothetical protein Sradi_6997500 [Sesamum radiatum]|uniref:Uncharacterized protein n=1 Tax=Sesamum radiatum TaxID=300843 RepID=A0AAW2JCP0_SESRA